jgi:hypothetical protein
VALYGEAHRLGIEPVRHFAEPIAHEAMADREVGVAILAAVLLKWFCIEAFQIPTSSMQPTLMGLLCMRPLKPNP